MNKLLLSFLLIFLTFAASAQQIITDRPDQTEASSTVGKGILQIESGFSFMTEDMVDPIPTLQVPRRERRLETYAWPNTLFRIGIARRFELRVVTQPELQRTFNYNRETNQVFGLADLQVGFKVNLLQAKEGRPEIGFLSHVVLPTGTFGISGEEYGVINKLAVTHSLSETHTVAWNLGYDYLGTGNGNLFYSLAWGISISDRISIYLEPYGAIDNLSDLVASADAGFTYLLKDNMQFDYSFGLGITHEMNYHAVGLSVRLPY